MGVQLGSASAQVYVRNDLGGFPYNYFAITSGGANWGIPIPVDLPQGIREITCSISGGASDVLLLFNVADVSAE